MTALRASRRPRRLGRLALVVWMAGAPAGAAALVFAGHSGTALAATSTSPTTAQQASNSSSGTTTTTAPPSPPPALGAALLPCGAPKAGAPCAVDPGQLQADLAGGSDVTAVQVSWVAEPGRSSPVPSQNQPTILQVVNSVGCVNPAPVGSGQTATCWNWPQSMDYPAGGAQWVLNGTYQVSPCKAVSSSGSCTPSAEYAPSQVQVAVNPSAPANLSATSQGGNITLRWQAGPEPDLVGYLVARNSEDVFTCSTAGFGPGSGRSCTSPLSFSQAPGVGTWNYQVEALRFGSDASAAHVVHSLASTVVATVSAPTSAGGATVVHLSVPPPPIPPSGTMAVINAPSAVGGRPPTTAAVAEGQPGVAQVGPNLPYSDNPALGGAQPAEETGTAERPAAKVGGNVNSAAEIALAVIALSLAAHAWYVRDELRRAAVRVSARSAIER